MTDHLIHITEGEERWDHIAGAYYGDGTEIAPLLKANPQLVRKSPAPLVLPTGTRVIVPILQASETQAAQLPPWKRTDG